MELVRHSEMGVVRPWGFLRLCPALLLVAWTPASRVSSSLRDRRLVFDEDGQFKIAQFADCKDGQNEEPSGLTVAS